MLLAVKSMLITVNFISYIAKVNLWNVIARLSKYRKHFWNWQIFIYLKHVPIVQKLESTQVFAWHTCTCTAMVPYWCHFKMCMSTSIFVSSYVSNAMCEQYLRDFWSGLYSHITLEGYESSIRGFRVKAIHWLRDDGIRAVVQVRSPYCRLQYRLHRNLRMLSYGWGTRK